MARFNFFCAQYLPPICLWLTQKVNAITCQHVDNIARPKTPVFCIKLKRHCAWVIAQFIKYASRQVNRLPLCAYPPTVNLAHPAVVVLLRLFSVQVSTNTQPCVVVVLVQSFRRIAHAPKYPNLAHTGAWLVSQINTISNNVAPVVNLLYVLINPWCNSLHSNQLRTLIPPYVEQRLFAYLAQQLRDTCRLCNQASKVKLV